MMKPQAQLLEFFLIFTPFGLIGILQGRFTSWWGDGMNSKMVLLVSIFFIVFGIFFLFMFIRWLFWVKFDSSVMKDLLKICIWYLGIILFVVFGSQLLPFFIVLIICGWYFVSIHDKLQEMDEMFEEKKDEE